MLDVPDTPRFSADLEVYLRDQVNAPSPARRVAPGALGALAAVAAATAVGVAAAAGPESARVSALEERPPADLSPVAERMATSSSILDEVDAAPEKARSVRAPAGRSGRWALMPSGEGVCLVEPSNAIACGTTEAINAGRFFAFSAPNAMPEKLSPSQIKDAQAGSSIQGENFSLAGATVTGIVPDEAVAVALLDSSGETLAKSSVVDNLYGVSDVDVSAVATVRLVHADGSSTDTPLR